MSPIKYSIKAPDSVKDVANTFKEKLKNKTKLKFTIKLKNAEKRDKPSDIDIVFIPVVSRTGTDIDAAVSSIKDDKPVLLVVLHHTFNPETVVPDSSKFVVRENTFTVDCLFFEDKGLLKCNNNDKAYKSAIAWLKSMKSTLKKKKCVQKGSRTKS